MAEVGIEGRGCNIEGIKQGGHPKALQETKRCVEGGNVEEMSKFSGKCFENASKQ